MGKGTLAIKIADWLLNSDNFELVKIVPVIPEPTWTDSLISWAKENQIPFVESGNYEDLENISSDDYEIDLVFSCFYDKIIKEWFISKCTKIINLHNGPLPRYRGVLPINWALKNNEIKHGVTIHEITKGIDDGPIISQVEYSIYPNFDEVEHVYNRAIEFAWTLFKETMPNLYKIEPREQKNELATYYGKNDSHRLGDRLGYNRNI
tara:strand:- start:12 stop:632 length:621 start_codon:yes stop_codon:yes gene_type:complete